MFEKDLLDVGIVVIELQLDLMYIVLDIVSEDSFDDFLLFFGVHFEIID